MRFPTKILTAAAALLLASAPLVREAQAAPHATVTAAWTAPSAVLAAPVAVVALTQDAKIDVNIDDDSGGAWYTSPVWIAIGVIALILIIVLITMAGRGRDTTVVK